MIMELNKLKSLRVLFLIFLLLISPLNIYAQETSAVQPSTGAVKPGNIFYFLDTWFDNVKIFFSANKDMARKEVALERLAEARETQNPITKQQLSDTAESYVIEIKNDETKREIVTIGKPIITDDIDYEREKLEIIKAVNNDIWAKRFLEGINYIIIKVVGFQERSFKVNIKADGSISSIEDFTYRPITIEDQKTRITCMAQFICPDRSSRTGCSYDEVCKPYPTPTIPTIDDTKLCPSVCVPMYELRETSGKISCEYITCGSGCGPDNKLNFNTIEECKAMSYQPPIIPKRPEGYGFTVIIKSQVLGNWLRNKNQMSFLSLLSIVQQLDLEPQTRNDLIKRVQRLYKEYGGLPVPPTKPIPNADTNEKDCIAKNGRWYDGVNNCYPSNNPTAVCTSGCYKDSTRSGY